MPFHATSDKMNLAHGKFNNNRKNATKTNRKDLRDNFRAGAYLFMQAHLL